MHCLAQIIMEAQTDKEYMRLNRWGFFDSMPATQEELEKAYSSKQKELRNNSDLPEDKLNSALKKLKSAFKNIGKSLQHQAPEPSTDDDEEEA